LQVVIGAGIGGHLEDGATSFSSGITGSALEMLSEGNNVT